MLAVRLIELVPAQWSASARARVLQALCFRREQQVAKWAAVWKVEALLREFVVLRPSLQRSTEEKVRRCG
jgi:hypothetical protein